MTDIAVAVSAMLAPRIDGCHPAERAKPWAQPTETPVAVPSNAPAPEIRFHRCSSSPGTSTPSVSVRCWTLSSGVRLGGRPRAIMSRKVTAFNAVVPAAPAAAPRRIDFSTVNGCPVTLWANTGIRLRGESIGSGRLAGGRG
ncbi:hypothetical protein ABZ894_02345 [Nocardia beijingensis]|uniref:hypothetical protein n=1 Tax=Nocardia beijingensis TaxID=95162 RepID=UPI0033E1A5E1